MHAKIWFLVGVSALLVSGCTLGGSGKDACTMQSDCLDGYLCVENECHAIVGDADGGGDDADDGVGPGGGPGDPPGDAFEYGEAASFQPESATLTAIDYDTLLGVSDLAGDSGCALGIDETAAPGRAAAVAYAKVNADSGDTRCPEGVYAIVNDPDECSRSALGGGLRPGCALYKRWDADGAQVASRLAIGGHVTVQLSALAPPLTGQLCEVDLQLELGGGVTIEWQYDFTYDPFDAGSAFCSP